MEEQNGYNLTCIGRALSLFILGIFCINLDAQTIEKKNSIGLYYGASIIQSVQQFNSRSDYYSVYGFADNFGIRYQRGFKDWGIVASFGQTELVNSYDLFRILPLMSIDEKSNNKTILNFHWQAKRYELDFSKDLFHSGKFKLSSLTGFAGTMGQLNIENFPFDMSLGSGVLSKSGYSINNKEHTLFYQFGQSSIKELAMQLTFGLNLEMAINNSISFNLCARHLSGLTPATSSSVSWFLEPLDGSGNISNTTEVVSNNTGFELQFGLDYSF